MQAKGINYVIRMCEDWWLEVGINDKAVIFTLSVGEKELLKKYNTTDNKIKCRLVCTIA